jgi:phospholipid/cholesterol/gamma-HCH transport system substrate-binding protein
MSDRGKGFALGLFVLVCAALIIWLVLFLRPSVGDGNKVLRIRFSNIEKVTVGTRVTFAGKPIGEVVEICEIHDARDQPTDASGNLYFYELVIRIDSHIKVYNYDDIVFSTAGLLGEKTIAIVPKQPPPGCPPAHELKDGVLYAKSTDKIEDAVTKLMEVADVFEQTMCEALCFFKENGEQFNTAITSFNSCSAEVHKFFARANQCDLAGHFTGAVERAEVVFGQAIDSNIVTNLGAITAQVGCGQGSLGRLIYSDAFYFQLLSSLNRLEQVMSDLANYGLFYQFNSNWQRQKRYRCLSSSYEVDQELQGVTRSLKKVEKAIGKMPHPEIEEVVKRMQALKENLDMTLNKEIASQ